MTEVQRLQAQQADAALEEIKRQVELNSEKVYAEMKEQVRRSQCQPFCNYLSQWDSIFSSYNARNILHLIVVHQTLSQRSGFASKSEKRMLGANSSL